jgi:hypothetical protein
MLRKKGHTNKRLNLVLPQAEPNKLVVRNTEALELARRARLLASRRMPFIPFYRNHGGL